jgi:hypothetical protein
MKWTKIKPGIYQAEGTDYRVESVRADGPWIIRSRGRKGKTEFKTMRDARARVEGLAGESTPEVGVSPAAPSVTTDQECQGPGSDHVQDSERPVPAPNSESPAPTAFRVILGRIGRKGRRDLGTITVSATTAHPDQDLAFEIHKRIRSLHLLASPWFRVEVSDGKVRVEGGRFGYGTVTPELGPDCSLCGEPGGDVMIDPYIQEIYGDEKWVRLHSQCASERCDEI